MKTRLQMLNALCLLLLASCAEQSSDAATERRSERSRVTVEVRDGPRDSIEFRSEGAGPPTAVFPAIGDRDLPSQVGVRDGTRLKSTGSAGFLQFGPYITLPAGDYRVSWIGRVETARAAPPATVDVVSNAGRTTLASAAVTGGDGKAAPLAAVDFSLARAESLIEFRLRVAEGTVATLERIELSRR